MVWAHRSLDMYRWHQPKHLSSLKYPFALHPPPPFKVKVKVFYTHKVFSPMVDRDSVELEAKGQASAQSTTGTVTCVANKKIKWHGSLIFWGNLENLGNLEILVILRILRILDV